MAAKRTGLARTRKAAGLTQESLAEALHIDRTTIVRWESGKSEPQPYLRPKLARMLGVPLTKLEELLAPAQPVGAPDAAWEPSAAANSLLPTLGVDETAHAAKALVEASRYFDSKVVDYFRRQLGTCMVDDGELGPSKTLPNVLGLLHTVERCAREVKPSLRRELLSFGACTAEFAGWLYRDTNNPAQATAWYDRAMEWAQEALDLPMQGYILLKKSQMAYDAHDPVRVFTLAMAAQEGPWQLPTKVRAEVTQQTALGLAMLGEPIAAVERTLDDAHQILDHATHNDDQSDKFGAYFNACTLQLRNASCFTEAGKPGRAAVIFGDVLQDAPLSRRDNGYFSSRRAAALALSGEPDEAATVGLTSNDVATFTRSERTLRVLSEVVQTLSPWRSRPAVRELRDAMRVPS